ncbi:Metallophosphoesterase [Cordyceps militaris]|uniref:Metallophosphoesterase n=1 Tax=Cordyceps militaris TaxID=73501 RepID=A0A2H4SL86_CORMI|nr:Metallophosphoesterase [Cordyceps militaris]
MLVETLLVAAMAGAAVEAAPAFKPPLQFTTDGNFHISVFNDIHFGENAAGQGPVWDSKTSQLMGTIMDAEKPQLVVLNGDLISGDQYQGSDILDHVDRIVKPIAARRLPWASTYGNHDSNYNLSRDQMLQREKTYNGSYTERMVSGQDAGVTNYYLPVYADAGCNASSTTSAAACVPELLLWFFDSRGGKYYRTHNRQPDWVDTSVVDWFKATSAQLAAAYGRVVPSIAFVHIPIHVTTLLQKQGPGGHLDLRRHPGINDDKINGQSVGWPPASNSSTQPSGPGGYSGRDVPFMQALAAAKGLVGLFYGHDHGNTWCYRWAGHVDGLDADGAAPAGTGLHLCYGQHTGYGGYGNWIRGGRQIVVTRAGLRRGTLDTHTRLETGAVVGAVTLNSTFNDDVYDLVPDTKTMMPLPGKAATASTAAGTRSGWAAAWTALMPLGFSLFWC